MESQYDLLRLLSFTQHDAIEIHPGVACIIDLFLILLSSINGIDVPQRV